MKTLENMLSKVRNKYGIIKNFIANKPEAYKVSILSFIFIVMSPVFFLFYYMFVSFDVESEEAAGMLLFFGALVILIVDYIAGITSIVTGLYIVKSFKHSLLWLIPVGILLLVPIFLNLYVWQ